MPDYTTSDLAYLFRNFRTLDEICAGRNEAPRVSALIEEGRLPWPSYPLEGYDGFFPVDYFDLVDEAGGTDRLRDHFAARYRLAEGPEDELEQDWRDYLAGLWGVCLRRVTPEGIVRKGQLVEAIEQLLEEPQPHEGNWCEALRIKVDALDRLERPFAPDFDRDGRFPRPPSRDRLIAFARLTYPDAFASISDAQAEPARPLGQCFSAASRLDTKGDTTSVEPGSPLPQ